MTVRSSVYVAVSALLAVLVGLLVSPVWAGDGVDANEPAEGLHTEAIDTLDTAGYLAGTECDRRDFCPDEPLQNWMLAIWLARAIEGNDPAEVSQTRFEDLDEYTDWLGHIEWFADLNVVEGCGFDPPRFCPDQAMTRSQAARVLARAFKFPAAETALFRDLEGVTNTGDIDAIAAAGVTVGCSVEPLLFCPDALVTRGQMATLLRRALDKTAVGPHSEAIDALDAAGYLAGTECDRLNFCPDDPLQNWMLAIWLVRAIEGNDPAEVSRTRFKDVDEYADWLGHIERFADLNVVEGCGIDPPRFCPDQVMTRSHAARVLARAFKFPPAEAAGFRDVEGVTNTGDIDAIAAAGVTVGCSVEPLLFCPDALVTRGQMATFVYRALKLAPVPPHEPAT